MTIIENAVLMRVGKTANDWCLSEELIKNSLDTFINAPITYNKDAKIKDYTNMEVYYNTATPIGIILDVRYENGEVLGTIAIYEEYANLWKGEYDNWCVSLDKGDKFKFQCSEVF